MSLAARQHISFAALAATLSLFGWVGCRTASPPAAQPPAGHPPAGHPVGAASPAAAESSAPTPAPAAATPAAPAAPYKNTVRWTTASEVDSFGFDVFRAEKEEGPFERLNAKPIPGAGTSDESHSYAWVDDTIDPTKEYYYYVESISIDGVREKFTPVSRARAKLASPPVPAP
jgi:hypothetical protein